MSWNTARILNNLAFDVSNVKKKTSEIVETNDDGTIFDKYVYSDGFVVNNVENTGYLRSDGTVVESTQQGQPNIYLYRNSNNVSNDPPIGQIRFNSNSNSSATHVYINETTDDNVNISLFLNEISIISILYIQDKNNQGQIYCSGAYCISFLRRCSCRISFK